MAGTRPAFFHRYFFAPSLFSNDMIQNTYVRIYHIDNSDEEITFYVHNVVKLVKDIDINKSSGIE